MIDPISIASMINLILVITKALEAGVEISARVETLLSKARAENRDITEDELDVLRSETDFLRDRRREALAEASRRSTSGG